MATFLYIHDSRLEFEARNLNWGYRDHGDAYLALSAYDLAVNLRQTISAKSHLAALPLLIEVKAGQARFKEVTDRAEASPDFFRYAADVMHERARYELEVLNDFTAAQRTIETLLRARYGIGGFTKADIGLDLKLRQKILLHAAYNRNPPIKPPLWWIGRIPVVGSRLVNAMIDRELGL